MKRKWMYIGLKILFTLSIVPPLFGKVTQNEAFLTSFTRLGYPVYLSKVLAVAYILGVVALWQSKSQFLKEWAYAGFTFALLGGFLSHVFAKEPFLGIAALVSLVFLLVAYLLNKSLASNT